MKRFPTILLQILFYSLLSAQVPFLQLSPFQKLEQKIGATDITIEYSRPSMKGRKIFGGLEPFNETWRTGANRNTKVTFSTFVQIGGQKLEPGTYALFTKPDPEEWEVYFYTDVDNLDVPEPMEQEKLATAIKVIPQPTARPIETLTITIDDISSNFINLGIRWERTYIAVPIEIPTTEVMNTLIEKSLAGHADDYYLAAKYYLDAEVDLAKAKSWITKAIDLGGPTDFWNYWILTQIEEKRGDRKAAITACRKALAMARERKTNSFYLDRFTSTLEEWGAL